MRVSPIQRLKEILVKIIDKSASKEHPEGTFWSDPKKRKGIVFLIIGSFVVFLASALPDSTVRSENTEGKFDLITNDLSGESTRPTNVFTEAGADKLDQIASEDLVQAMQDEMAYRERNVQQREQQMAEVASQNEVALNELHIQQQAAVRELKNENDIKIQELNNKKLQEMQAVINALSKGEDVTGIAPGLKIPEGGLLTDKEPQIANVQPSVIIGPNGKQTAPTQYTIGQTRSQVARPSNIAQAGIRVMNGENNFRVATGQFIDLNNAESIAQNTSAGSQEDKLDVYQQLELAKATLNAKRMAEHEQATIAAIEAKEAETHQANIIPLTAGSVLSGTLINGMYVPTTSSSTTEPMPAIFRIKKEAILPNYFVSSEVVECVIVAAARPAIESIRVNFRASTITCIRDDGVAIEDSIKAISTGSDGSTGIPATLISRNSEILMKTAMAGFLTGITDIMSQTSIEVNSEDGVFAISGADLGKLTGSAALGGAGDALDRLSAYFIDIANKMQPTLHVAPGIEVDFLVTSLSELNFNPASTKVRQ